jgi:hypothetical protein
LGVGGFDFQTPVSIDFNVDFAEWPPSGELITKLAENYEQVEFHESDEYRGYVSFVVTEKVSYELVTSVQRSVSELAAPYGGVCESWGSDAITMSTIERAIEIAAAAHAGQVDKAGQPYILHPLRVMLRVSSDAERMAAVLHDVVEDTPVTLAQLTESGFPAEVVAAIEALTKRPGENRMQAAARAASNPIARAVKLADNAENMDLGRIANPTEKDLARIEEYKQVRALLLASDSN